MQTRPYQNEAFQSLRQKVRDGFRSPLLQAGTGLGKTVIASALIRSAVDKGKRVLVLVPRRQIVWQTEQKLREFDVHVGIIMSGERPSLMPNVQIASVNTLYSRCFEDGKPVTTEMGGRGMPLPPADLLVIDEAHATFGKMARSIIAAYPDAVKIGMTATPIRSTGEGLGEVYDTMVCGPSIRWAMDNDYLCEVRYFGPSEWDVSDVPIQGGDYHQGKLSEAVNQPKLVGDVVTNYTRIAYGKIAVVFAVDRKHARALYEEFTGHGIPSEYIDGQTPNDERNAMFDRLENRESLVLCSVAVVDMGWDAPWAEVGILARHTKSLARYIQLVGRILRPDPDRGKYEAYLIDHTGAVHDPKLGFVDRHIDWKLDGREVKESKQKEKPADEQITVTCPGCSAVIRPAPQCPECGKEMKSESKRAIEAKQAELEEIARKESDKTRREWSMDEKRRFFGELRGIARDRGYKDGWAVHTYQQRIGALPWPVYKAPAMEPSEDTVKWAKYLQIKWAKARAAAGERHDGRYN